MKRVGSAAITCGVIFVILLLLRVLRVTENGLILSLIGAALFLLGAFFLRLLAPSVRTGKFFALKNMSFLEWRLTVCFALDLIFGSFLLNYLSGMLLRRITQAPTAYSAAGYPSVPVALLCIAVLPAVTEELFFRGAVQTTLRMARLRTVLVICLPAFFFMLMHGNLWYFSTNFFAGALLSLLVYLTGSSYAAMFAHFLSNFVSFFIAMYSARLASVGNGTLMVHVMVVCLIGALCHTLHLIKKLILRRRSEDRSGVNENSRLWEKKNAKIGETES